MSSKSRSTSKSKRSYGSGTAVATSNPTEDSGEGEQQQQPSQIMAKQKKSKINNVVTSTSEKNVINANESELDSDSEDIIELDDEINKNQLNLENSLIASKVNSPINIKQSVSTSCSSSSTPSKIKKPYIQTYASFKAYSPNKSNSGTSGTLVSDRNIVLIKKGEVHKSHSGTLRIYFLIFDIESSHITILAANGEAIESIKLMKETTLYKLENIHYNQIRTPNDIFNAPNAAKDSGFYYQFVINSKFIELNISELKDEIIELISSHNRLDSYCTDLSEIPFETNPEEAFGSNAPSFSFIGIIDSIKPTLLGKSKNKAILAGVILINGIANKYAEIVFYDPTTKLEINDCIFIHRCRVDYNQYDKRWKITINQQSFYCKLDLDSIPTFNIEPEIKTRLLLIKNNSIEFGITLGDIESTDNLSKIFFDPIGSIDRNISTKFFLIKCRLIAQSINSAVAPYYITCTRLIDSLEIINYGEKVLCESKTIAENIDGKIQFKCVKDNHIEDTFVVKFLLHFEVEDINNNNHRIEISLFDECASKLLGIEAHQVQADYSVLTNAITKLSNKILYLRIQKQNANQYEKKNKYTVQDIILIKNK